MADPNQNQSPLSSGTPQSNIDDLVKELSRPNQPAPTVPPRSVPPQPAPTTPPPRPTMPTNPPVPPKPVMPPTSPTVPAPAPKPQPAPPTGPAAAPPYQSNIRTMADDLASLKSGHQPQGTTMPRPVAPVPAPVKPASPAMPSPLTGPGPLPKPVTPAPVKLTPPSSAPAPARPAMPAPARPAMPQMAPPPSPVRPAPPGRPDQLYTPEKPVSSGGRNRNLLFIIIGVAVVAFGILYWALFIRPGGESVVDIPTQTAMPLPTATPRIPVSSLFSGSAGTITLTADADPLQTFLNGIKTMTLPARQLGVLAVSDASAGQALSPFQLLDRMLIAYPVDLKPLSRNDDGVILAYGQQEAFNAKGQPVQGAASPRWAIVTAVSDSAAASLRSWEPTMTDNLAVAFGVDKAKNTGPFSDALYQGIAVRYKNFAYPDKAIDYALVTYSGKTYLVMASSREAMFAVLNVFSPLGK